MLFDNMALAESCRCYLADPTPRHQNVFFQQVVFFSEKEAYRYLYNRRNASLASLGWTLLEDVQSYFLEKLFQYLSSAEFNRQVWKDRPLACLHTYFQSRASEYVDRETRINYRLEHQDQYEEGWDGFASHTPSPEAEYFRNAVVEEVRQAVGKLPPLLGRVCQARYELNLTAREIADALDLPVETVYTHQAKLKRSLKSRLSKKKGVLQWNS